jgi:hypothetical protein
LLLRGARERVYVAERAGHRLHRRDNRRHGGGLRLERGKGRLDVRQRCVSVRTELGASRRLDAMQRAHGLRDGRR